MTCGSRKIPAWRSNVTHDSSQSLARAILNIEREIKTMMDPMPMLVLPC